MEENRAITFSFGKNWQDYLSTVSEPEIESAQQNILNWVPREAIVGKRVIDIGSGSGIHSLCFHRLGARELVSIDVDPRSVAATRSLWTTERRPENWRVEECSILKESSLQQLGEFDIVYSWGVLHHTGQMWTAIDHAARLVQPLGLLWISIYQKGPGYSRDLALKQRYNAATEGGKRWMERQWIAKEMFRRLKRFKNPFGWFQKTGRGMNSYHDLIDWLGGLPYEVADANEIIQFSRKRGLILEKIRSVNEGGCSNYLLQRIPGLAHGTGQTDWKNTA